MKNNKHYLTTVALFTTLMGTFSSLISKEKKAKTSSTTTSSAWNELHGMRYKILSHPPKGAKSPQKNNRVRVHYTLWLSEKGECGKKIDSSVDRGKPFEFILGVGQVIKGWDLIVADMKPGEKRKVHIPATLAYGAQGAGRTIPPHAELIFDIEMF